MEVDLQSPSFRHLRSLPSASKRARSPDSFVDRPSKRLSLSLNHPAVRQQIRHSYSSENVTPSSSACNSRFSSEEWVQQADGLSIDSPVVAGSAATLTKDEDMNMDPDEAEAQTLSQIERVQRPDLPPIRTTSLTQQAALHEQHHLPSSHLRSSSSAPPTAMSISSSSSAASALIVRVLPPTPASNLHPSAPYLQVNNIPPTRPSTPVSEGANGSSSSSSAMLLSSPVSPLPSSPASSILRRQRFTMGPRADCPKCQLGIKGHSVHY